MSRLPLEFFLGQYDGPDNRRQQEDGGRLEGEEELGEHRRADQFRMADLLNHRRIDGPLGAGKAAPIQEVEGLEEKKYPGCPADEKGMGCPAARFSPDVQEHDD